MSKQQQKGFTLVEMSIVLVIIGLIVGGVLVGQDLVRAAQVRAVVSQLQQFDAAINTFRGKYDGFPGDMSKAAAFLGAAAQNGDGDGRLGDAATSTATAFGGTAGTNDLAGDLDGELLSFWHHLSLANMVAGEFSGDGTAVADAVVNTGFPATRLKKGSIVAVSEGSTNMWVVGASNDLTDISGDASLAGAGANNLTATEAFGIDNKVDDGMANTGLAFHVLSNTADAFGRIGTTAAVATGAAGATCWATTPAAATEPVDFQLSNETNACTLVVRMQG